MISCYLGIGSNLNNPLRQLKMAIQHIHALPRTQIEDVSDFYSSTAQGPRGQPNYINIAVHIRTALSPVNLLKYCQTIEAKQKRIRKKNWGARTIDIDILLYGNRRFSSAYLQIPHKYMHLRDFVLIPLLELNPFLYYPNGSQVKPYEHSTKKYILSKGCSRLLPSSKLKLSG